MLDDLLELRTGDQIPCDGDGAHRRRASRSTSRCSPARATRSTRPRATRCCRAASWSPGSGRFQATRVGADAYAAQARRRGPPVPAHPLGADGRHQHDPAHRHVGARSRCRRCCSGASSSDHDARRGAARRPSPASSAMVPEGLVLLTSIAFVRGGGHARPAQGAGAGAARGRGPRARRRRVPRQDRHAHRGRDRVRRARGARRRRRRRRRAPRSARSRPTRTATPPLVALAADVRRADGWTRTGAVPFSSARKWSAASFDGHGSLGDGCARDGARRRHARRRGSAGRRARGRRAARARARPQRRRRSTARRCPPTLAAGRARDVRREDPARRRRDARATSPSRAWRSR